ncbi:MAG: PSD1 and planctomycete cytochrome C domain-containing protein [Planctomycetaceae bacterium]
MIRSGIIFSWCLLLTAFAASAEDADIRQDRAFFENRIRPVLVAHCYECHSEASAEVGGRLLLDSRSGMLSGGEAGPVLVPGKPDDSLILLALKHDGIEMPPDRRLSDAVVRDFETWIGRGAFDPRTDPAPHAGDAATSETDKPDAAELWSLQPVTVPEVPPVQDDQWATDPIDRFVLAKLEAESLRPGPDAEDAILVRRLFFDLIGLPPTVDELEAWSPRIQQNRTEGITALVDDLLSRPQFGEHWGRHWLDVARYAESNGNDGLGRNPTFPHAWRYRDYVIAAFNSDMAYDQFLREQLAGDLLPAETPQDRDRQLVATGLLAMTAKPAKAMNNNFDMDVVADQIDVVGRGVMGLSVACARCHDHKFDPVPTRDYYALAGIFASTETMWGVAGHEGLTAPPTDLHVLKATEGIKPPDNFVETVVLTESDTGKPKKIPKSRWPTGAALAMGVRDKKEATDLRIHVKGEPTKTGDPVPRGFLSAIAVTDAPVAAPDATGSGRLQLAMWLTKAEHPLTARVMVNRIWMHLFGEGLVRTPDDFGVYGDRPTHPELLDHLASRFVQNGWSVKSMIRAIALSRTYQISSCITDPEQNVAADSRLLQTHQRRRLDAEQFRDAVLAVCGDLDLQPARGSIIQHRDILVNLAGNLHQPSRHRSLYLCYLRNSPPPELAAFDLPDFAAVQSQRTQSVIPAQALFLFNSSLMQEQSKQLAEIIQADQSDPRTAIRLVWREVLQRNPTDQEAQQAADFLNSTSDDRTELERWAGLCQALLASNEFRYID